MVRYLALLAFTEHGLSKVKESIERASQFQSKVVAAGGRVLHQYWCIGECDGCLVFEVPNDETGAALLLELGRAANVRTRTLRIFDDAEFESILGKMN